jgi:hypothetical protein
VLDDPGGVGGAVAEQGQFEPQLGQLHSQFADAVAPYGVGHRFAGQRVAAERVRPDPRPAALRKGAARDEQTARVVEQIAGEREVERSVGAVYGVFGHPADLGAVGGEQYHLIHLVLQAFSQVS